MAAIFSIVLAIALLIALPRKYTSEAKFLVKIGRESVGLDPTATTSQTLLMQKTQEEEVNSALEVIYSRSVKEDVIRKIGVDAIMSGYLPTDEEAIAPPASQIRQKVSDSISSVGDFLLEIGVRDPVDDFERAIIKLENSVYVFATKKTQVISINTEAKSPEMAQRIVDEMTSSYLEHHLKISQTSGSYEFFKRETEQSKIALDKAKNEMAQFMADNQIVSVESNQALLKDTWNGILSNILALENEQNTLASSYSENHPLRMSAKARLDSARKALVSLKKTDVKKLPAEIKAVLEKAEAVDSKVEDVEPDEQALTLVGRIDELILANNQLEIMLENVRTLEAQLIGHRQKFEEARLIRVQQESSISNISVFQPATFNRKPTSPNKLLVLAGTFFSIFTTAFLFCIWRETKRRSGALQKVIDVERVLKVPVVATIPVDRSASGRYRNKSSLGNLRRKCHDAVHSIMNSRQNSNDNDGPNKKDAVVVGVLGIEKGAGGSTIASAMAGCCSKDFGLKTLLIDVDAKSKSISARFSLNGAPGLSELIEGADLEDCLQHFKPFDLSIVASTNKDRTASKLVSFGVADVKAQLDRLSNKFDVIILDLPPASDANSVSFLATQLESVMLVAHANKTTAMSAIGVLRKFENSETKINGIVLNKYRREFPWESNS